MLEATVWEVAPFPVTLARAWPQQCRGRGRALEMRGWGLMESPGHRVAAELRWQGSRCNCSRVLSGNKVWKHHCEQGGGGAQTCLLTPRNLLSESTAVSTFSTAPQGHLVSSLWLPASQAQRSCPDRHRQPRTKRATGATCPETGLATGTAAGELLRVWPVCI